MVAVKSKTKMGKRLEGTKGLELKFVVQGGDGDTYWVDRNNPKDNLYLKTKSGRVYPADPRTSEAVKDKKNDVTELVMKFVR